MKNFAKTVSRFLLCERLSDWAKLGVTGVYRFHDADSRHRQNRTVRYFEIYVSCNYGNE